MSGLQIVACFILNAVLLWSGYFHSRFRILQYRPVFHKTFSLIPLTWNVYFVGNTVQISACKCFPPNITTLETLLQLEISDICILGNPFGKIYLLHRQLWLENLMVFGGIILHGIHPVGCFWVSLDCAGFVLWNKRQDNLNLTCSCMGSLCRWWYQCGIVKF